jgi:hypothetical protein
VRDIYRPAHDVLRSAGDDDRCGGVLDHAVDRFTLSRRRVTVAP